MAEQRSFRCQACGKEFRTRQQLDDHKRKEHQQGAQKSAASVGSSVRGQTPGMPSGQSGSEP